ncbi:hypothetical protein HanLR1_Chr02g0062741 [Helianthus annuus]|nr:hypothetical protein HanHA89_Chr02g0068511 [Helianthus annuus]KAJ0777633.1 hypothetical protein HanLR1_Chr02g0062741 [Helianthus annuus]
MSKQRCFRVIVVQTTVIPCDSCVQNDITYIVHPYSIIQLHTIIYSNI